MLEFSFIIAYVKGIPDINCTVVCPGRNTVFSCNDSALPVESLEWQLWNNTDDNLITTFPIPIENEEVNSTVQGVLFRSIKRKPFLIFNFKALLMNTRITCVDLASTDVVSLRNCNVTLAGKLVVHEIK